MGKEPEDRLSCRVWHCDYIYKAEVVVSNDQTVDSVDFEPNDSHNKFSCDDGGEAKLMIFKLLCSCIFTFSDNWSTKGGFI